MYGQGIHITLAGTDWVAGEFAEWKVYNITSETDKAALDFRHRTTPHHIRVHDQRGGRREPSTVQFHTVQWGTQGVGEEQQPHSTIA
ncbi:hypothetical protein BDR05DRAFT_194125 [Suillus weaverae]|nr:hypothetical protein BDR05DRAFT_194125 [Suillus weaverae]